MRTLNELELVGAYIEKDRIMLFGFGAGKVVLQRKKKTGLMSYRFWRLIKRPGLKKLKSFSYSAG